MSKWPLVVINSNASLFHSDGSYSEGEGQISTFSEQIDEGAHEKANLETAVTTKFMILQAYNCTGTNADAGHSKLVIGRHDQKDTEFRETIIVFLERTSFEL